jgi:hypothetical protein
MPWSKCWSNVLVEALGCFLEFMAVGSNVGAGVAAFKVQKRRKAKKEACQAGKPEPTYLGAMAALVILGFAAVFFTGLIVLKWARLL